MRQHNGLSEQDGAEDPGKLDLAHQKRSLKSETVFSFFLGSLSFFFGLGLVDIEPTVVFKKGSFLKLRNRCTVLGVAHESRTVSRERRGLDGVLRERFFCVDLYRYNFSIGP